MDRKSDEEIVLFVRDEQTGCFLFDDRAVDALGLDRLSCTNAAFQFTAQRQSAHVKCVAATDGEADRGTATSAVVSGAPPLLMAWGFPIEMLEELLARGLAKASAEEMKIARRRRKILCFQITDAGRKAAADN
jgi:hypothetical protein